jgi:hypothetical protein
MMALNNALAAISTAVAMNTARIPTCPPTKPPITGPVT